MWQCYHTVELHNFVNLFWFFQMWKKLNPWNLSHPKLICALKVYFENPCYKSLGPPNFEIKYLENINKFRGTVPYVVNHIYWYILLYVIPVAKCNAWNILQTEPISLGSWTSCQNNFRHILNYHKRSKQKQ